MNIILSSYSHKGVASLRQLIFYRFCTRSSYFNRRGPESYLFGKISQKTNLKAILDLYKENQKDFQTEHYAFTCKSIAKSLANSKDFRIPSRDPTLTQFVTKVNELVPNMNEIEIIDVLFLMRRQSYDQHRLFAISMQPLLDKVKTFLNEDRLVFHQMVSIFCSMSTIGLYSQEVQSALLKRFIDEKHPQYGKMLTFSNGFEILHGLGQKNCLLSQSQKRLVSEVVKNFDQNLDNLNLSPSNWITLLKALAKLNINDYHVNKFVNRLNNLLKPEMEHFTDLDLINLFDIGLSTNNHLYLKITNEAKNQFIDGFKNGSHKYSLNIILKIFNRLSNWLQPVNITVDQQNAILDYFEEKYDEFVAVDFARHPPRFTKLFSKQTAQIIYDTILDSPKNITLLLLSQAAKYTNVVDPLVKSNLIKNDLDLNSVLKLESILRDDRKLTPELISYRQSIPELVKKALSNHIQFSNYLALKNFLRDTPLKLQKRIRQVVKEQILNLTPQDWKTLIKRPDFVFVLMMVFSRGDAIIKKRLEQTGMRKVFNFRAVDDIIESIENSETYLITQFWTFANNFGLESKQITNYISFPFLDRSIRSIQYTNEFPKWLVSILFNSTLINNPIFALTMETAQNVKSSVVSKHILESLLSNVGKCTKVDKSQVMRFIRLLKRDGLLSKGASETLLKQYEYLEKDLPIQMASSLNNTESFSKISEKSQKMNLGLLETFLLFDFDLWKNHQQNVKEFIEADTLTINNKKWRNILSSIQGKHRKNPEYRDITNFLITKFLKEFEQKNASQITTILQKVSEMNPSLIVKHGLQSLKKTLNISEDIPELSAYLRILNSLGHYQTVNDFINTNQKLQNWKKNQLVWNQNATITKERALEMIESLNKISTNAQKDTILRALLLNDHIPEVKTFLQQNESTILNSNLKPVLKTYYKMQYLNQKQDSQQLPQSKHQVTNKIKQAAEKAGLVYEAAPVTNNLELSFRIGDKHFALTSQKNFLYYPHRKNLGTSSKLNSLYEIQMRIAELHTGLKIIPVPTVTRGLFVILHKQFPQLEAANNTEKKQEAEEEEGVEVEPEAEAEEELKTEADLKEELEGNVEEVEDPQEQNKTK